MCASSKITRHHCKQAQASDSIVFSIVVLGHMRVYFLHACQRTCAALVFSCAQAVRRCLKVVEGIYVACAQQTKSCPCLSNSFAFCRGMFDGLFLNKYILVRCWCAWFDCSIVYHPTPTSRVYCASLRSFLRFLMYCVRSREQTLSGDVSHVYVHLKLHSCLRASEAALVHLTWRLEISYLGGIQWTLLAAICIVGNKSSIGGND